MKYYKSLVELGCFSARDVSEKLALCDATAATLLQQYQKRGYIERVRHNLYVAMSLENNQPVLSRYEIGCRLFPDACISYHSAFEVYGYANQVYYDVYVMSNSRFKHFEYGGVNYSRVAPKGNVQTEQVGGVRVTGLEQTVIDSLDAVDRIGGLEELLRCLMLIPSLDEKKLLIALSEHDNGFLYQKTGFVFEQLRDSLTLSDDFFKACKEHIPKADRYLTKEHDDYVYNSTWRLLGPDDLSTIIDKGVDYDAI